MGAAATVGAWSGLELGCAGSPAPAECVVTPTYQEGPFYIDTVRSGLARHDVTEGLAGAPLRLRLTLVEAQTCAPCADLPVDIWSASPAGWYSGVDNALLIDGAPDETGRTYMRGHQVTDADGVVTFLTLFPGWYELTPPHIHFTTPLPGGRAYTWQFFFDDAFSEAVYTSVAPYAQRGVHPVRTDGRPRPDALVITPTGPPEAPVVDAVVGVDMTALVDRPDEY
jgi:protocatechuate 3,4-dioxygenase beta subunit